MNHEIIAKIKKLRLIKGFSQSQMADHLNITRSTYQKLEAGNNNYAWAKYLKELMTVLETTPKDFFSDIGHSVINPNNYEGNTGHEKTLHQKNIEFYEKLLQSKEEQIALLKDLVRKD